MEALPPEELARIHPLLLEDERRRNRDKYVYTYDVLIENWATEFSIWPVPNADALQIINGKVGYDDLLFEDQNEVEKGMFSEELRQFVAQHMPGGQMLCEATNYGACLKEKCPLFRAKDTEVGGEYGICGEYKMAFRK